MMSIAAIRNNNASSSLKSSANKSDTDYIVSKKIKKEDSSSVIKPTLCHNMTPSPKHSHENFSNNDSTMTSSQSIHGSTGNTVNSPDIPSPSSTEQSNGYNGVINGTNGMPYSAYNNNNSQQNMGLDSTGPLPNEIFELLNDFWRPNEMVTPDTHLLNGKFSRRSPEGSLDETVEEEKEADDDLTSLADADIGVDRTTQKRRYSRLSDGYERLKSVLPSVKDKRRVSKARILDEAINYIQRLESVTTVLKREHEKRLNMLNGPNGFFPDYSVQPYMRSLFQKQIYPSGMTSTKINQKMSATPSAVPKSPRMKQYSSPSYTSTNNGPTNIPTDYNYNNIATYGNSVSNSIYQSPDPSQLMNGESPSPITNNPPYSPCSLSPGNTTTSYQNGTNAINNSWPYQGGTMGNYENNSSQFTNYNSSRVGSTAYGSSSAYSSLNNNMWGNMSMNEGTTQVVPHTEHVMKVG